MALFSALFGRIGPRVPTAFFVQGKVVFPLRTFVGFATGGSSPPRIQVSFSRSMVPHGTLSLRLHSPFRHQSGISASAPCESFANLTEAWAKFHLGKMPWPIPENERRRICLRSPVQFFCPPDDFLCLLLRRFSFLSFCSVFLEPLPPLRNSVPHGVRPSGSSPWKYLPSPFPLPRPWVSFAFLQFLFLPPVYFFSGPYAGPRRFPFFSSVATSFTFLSTFFGRPPLARF